MASFKGQGRSSAMGSGRVLVASAWGQAESQEGGMSGPSPSPYGLASGHHMGLPLDITWAWPGWESSGRCSYKYLGKSNEQPIQWITDQPDGGYPLFGRGLPAPVPCSHPYSPSLILYLTAAPVFLPRVSFFWEKKHTKLSYFRLPQYVFVPPFSPSLPTVDRLERRHRVDLLPPRIVVAASRRSAGVKGGERQA